MRAAFGLLAAAGVAELETARAFALEVRDFLLDGAPHRIISGAMHYPRVHPGLWRDRIRTARPRTRTMPPSARSSP